MILERAKKYLQVVVLQINPLNKILKVFLNDIKIKIIIIIPTLSMDLVFQKL